MMQRASEGVALLDQIVPQSASANTYESTGTGSLTKFFNRFLVIVQLGAITGSGTVNAKVQGRLDSGSWGDISGKTMTELNGTGSDGSKSALINLSADEINDAGYNDIRISITTATAATVLSALTLGIEPRYAPANNNDASFVDEIIA